MGALAVELGVASGCGARSGLLARVRRRAMTKLLRRVQAVIILKLPLALLKVGKSSHSPLGRMRHPHGKSATTLEGG
jgi:hypothetical protein